MATFAVYTDPTGQTFVRLTDARWTRAEPGQLTMIEATPSPLQGDPLKNEVTEEEAAKLERNLQRARAAHGL